MKRRNFLKSAGLASSALMVPSFLQGATGRRLMSSRTGRILVVIQLSGGNDGLNSIVPYQNDIYYKLRPKLAIKKGEVLKLTDELGLNPALEGLRDLYDDGLLSIVNNVGYPNPDRSHFRSMDIWQTASDSREYLNTGWIGRYLDSQCEGCDVPYHALEVDDSLSLALKGKQRIGFAAGDPIQLKKQADNLFLRKMAHADHHHEEPAAYLYKTMIDTQSSSEYLYRQAKVYKSRVKYPLTPFGRDLKQVAELITADTDTQIYYLSLSGFDTHVNQKNQHARLLKQYAQGVKAFVSDLKKNNLLDDTLIMTFSEFGRRVKQNASGGTDHGTANNLYLIGGKLRKTGFYNSGPNLQNLDSGDLIYKVDFRQIYANIVDDWLQADSRQVLNGQFYGLKVV